MQNEPFLDDFVNLGFEKHSSYFQSDNKSSLNPDFRAWIVRNDPQSDWRANLEEGDFVDFRLKAYNGHDSVWF